jgi:NADPH-dependent curcumin reductase CurA
MKNIQVILARRPVGIPGPEHFALREVDVNKPSEGEVLVRISHWSVDPAMRGWANDVPNYSPPVALGDPMRAFAVGEVLASRHPDFAEGDVVEGLLGWQTHALVDAAAIARKVSETDLPRTYALGILGLNGTTAYFGLTESCAAKAGDTVVVSSAAGAVGSAVGQIAGILGCRTVGIAGGAEKKRQCLEEFGFDAAIDYKAEDVAAAIAATAPMAWTAISTIRAGRSRTL